MTKRDYERIARVLSRFSHMDNQAAIGAVIAVVAESLAASFAVENSRFSRDKFLAACDVPLKYFDQEAA